MNRKPSIFEKIADFVTGKGFYLVVLACVAAIGLSGYFLVRSVQGGLAGLEEDQPVGGSAHIVVTPTPGITSRPQASATPDPSAEPTSEPSATPAPSATPEPAASSEPTSVHLVFTWPVSGAVIVPFSVDALAYDETMGDWRTHSGVDIAAPVGTQVMAAAAGTVASVEQDDLMGTTVTIAHAEGLTSIYANLGEVPTVEAGDHVNAGDIIGAIGTTAVAESARAPHLHFEMELDGNSVDPVSYLPEQ